MIGIYRTQVAGYVRELVNSSLEWDAASSDNAHGVIENAINEASVKTANPD